MTKDYILRASCSDKPGIVAAVAACLNDTGCNIEDAAQFSDKFSGRFFIRMVLRPLAGSVENFQSKFPAVADHFSMDWDLHPADEKVSTLVLVSKEDHCLNDILYRVRTNHLPLDLKAVASNHEVCRDLVEHRDTRFEYLPITAETKADQEEKLTALIEETGAELIVMARYMQILSDTLCKKYAGRIINIHHSFLPGFKGAKPYHQAWERGVKVIGATAHFATADLDEGPIISQSTTPIDHAHTPEQLQVIGRDTEALVLSKALLAYAERRIFLHGNRTVVL